MGRFLLQFDRPVDFPNQSLPHAPLTFEAVDDLVGAHVRGRLTSTPQVSYAATEIGPLIELMMEANNGRSGPLLRTAWLDPVTQVDLRTALTTAQNVWLDGARRRGFMRTTFDPRNDADDVQRNRFLIAARSAAETSGLVKPIAQSLSAALREMESNIHEHSGAAGTGILAFQARPSMFEFVAADSGVGILATLREDEEFADLTDHGLAIHAALQDNVSRYGRGSGHGNGFRDLFLGLAHLNADLRFRSGDHALLISGSRPELKIARLAQKAPYNGFLAAVRCRPMMPESVTRH
jgi:anti-sigma regulatory factor (Ser/Thr protein kinase)